MSVPGRKKGSDWGWKVGWARRWGGGDWVGSSGTGHLFGCVRIQTGRMAVTGGARRWVMGKIQAVGCQAHGMFVGCLVPATC